MMQSFVASVDGTLSNLGRPGGAVISSRPTSYEGASALVLSHAPLVVTRTACCVDARRHHHFTRYATAQMSA